MDYYIYVIHIALQIIPHNIHLLFLLDVEVLSLNILAPIIVTHLIYIFFNHIQKFIPQPLIFIQTKFLLPTHRFLIAMVIFLLQSIHFVQLCLRLLQQICKAFPQLSIPLQSIQSKIILSIFLLRNQTHVLLP